MINPHPTSGPAALVAQAPRIHGGPGANGPARFDFSTTANACGPCPMALLAIREADFGHYPDPAYTALRQQLAALHQVAPGRLVLAASASEFIFRITAVSGAGPVAVPVHAFGDYATAARSYGREVVHTLAGASLAWFTDPASPSGEAVARPAGLTPQPDSAQPVWAVVDRACEPLRLAGASAWSGADADDVFQLYSPNKALGLTGVRAAYAIGPLHGETMVQRLEAACPSWPLGAAGAALLTAWASPAVQHWLAEARHTLRSWKLRQTAGFAELGWQVQPSVSNYGLLRPPVQTGMDAATYATQVVEPALAQAGVAWRNTTSFGLPGAWRVSVQPPAAQDHVWAVLRRLRG
jgi:histidinol-phosphate aminotransferase